MQALDLIESWPVDNVAAAVIRPDGVVDSTGDQDRQFRIASVAKPITTWACLVAVEEGIVALDQRVGQPGCTLRHLLSHAGGYPFDGTDPIAKPGGTRIYSNTGMTFDAYLSEAVFQPLGMASTTLQGSPAHRMRSTATDLVTFLTEVRSPTLITRATAAEVATIQFPELNGIVPGIGRYSPCPWGVGFEISGNKQPHWTGTTNSPSTFGHFGGAGTFIWVDPAVGVACLALTDRPFDEWANEALQLWPVFDDAVLAEASA